MKNGRVMVTWWGFLFSSCSPPIVKMPAGISNMVMPWASDAHPEIVAQQQQELHALAIGLTQRGRQVGPGHALPVGIQPLLELIQYDPQFRPRGDTLSAPERRQRFP